MKHRKSNLLLLIIFLIGLSLLLYPAASDYWNSFHQTRALASYTEAVAGLDDVSYEEYLEAAREYNRRLLDNPKRYHPTDEESVFYESLLNVTGSGIMGRIEIPVIGVSLPIYHGVEDTVLQIAVGHIEGSSLPVGGASTHCVVSGHRGLPSARLFTDLDKMEVGDVFILQVLDETLTYEVDQIHIVEPHEVELLEIEEGKDLCTLVTCTPYGINSHRMLVRGRRVENQMGGSPVRVTADAVQIDPVFVAPAAAVPMLLVLFFWLLAGGRRKKK